MARINRSHVRRLEEAAHEDAVRIPQRDGSVKLFDRMHVAGQIFLAQLDAGLGRPRRPSDVMDAVDHAPNEIRMRILREHSGSFMGDLDPADPAEGPAPDLSEQAQDQTR